ncbi:MAG: internalin [Psychrosphaera sp.]|nr:internalin [Psychrosphaera sp.]
MTWKMKPLAKAFCLLGLSAFAQASYAAQSVSQLADIGTLQRSTASGEDNDTVTLGTAYHSEKEGFYALQSVTGTIDESYGNTEVAITVGVDMSYNQLSNMLDGNLSAQLDVPVIKVNAGASYAKEHAADNYTGSYTLFASMKPKKRLLIPNDGSGFQATQGAIDLVNANPGDKFDDIGDEFVTAIEYGSQVMVNLKFEYKNAEDKVKWGGQLDVDWVGKVNVSGQLSAVNNDVKRDIKVTISAIQRGGDQNKILTVIPNGLASCSMQNPQPCFDIFKNTINYIKTDYIHQFNDLNDYNVTKIFTDRYRASGPGLDVLVPQGAYPSQSLLTKLAIKNMSEGWIEAIMDNRRADNLLNYYAADLSTADRNAIEDLRENALFNSFILADAVAYCNRNPIGSYCRTREVQTQGNVSAYDRNLLEL